MIRAPAAACLLLVAWTLCDAASAHPVRVRGRTTLALEAQRTPQGLVLGGRLTDDTGEPVAEVPAHLNAPELETIHLTTDEEGRFRALVPGLQLTERLQRGATALRWSARFDGNPRYGATTAHAELDLQRAQTRLTMRLEPRAPTLAGEPITVHLRLQGGPGPIAYARISLRVGEGPTLSGVTSAGGRVTFLLRPETLGRAGAHGVFAAFDGDHRFSGAETSAQLIVRRDTRLTLRVSRNAPGSSHSLRFSGRLTDTVGPIANAIVTVAMPSASPPRILAAARTDRDGVYVARAGADVLDALGMDRLETQSLYQPDNSLHASTASAMVSLTLPSYSALSPWWYLAALMLLVTTAGAVQLLERRPLWRLRRWLRRRRTPPARSTPQIPPFMTPGGPGEPRDPTRLAGQVCDAHRSNPLPGATIVLRGAGEELRCATGDDGRFSCTLEPGTSWTLTVDASGYLARHMTVSIPHGGSLDGATFALVAIRRRLRDILTGALQERGVPLRWGRDTPREAIADLPTPAPDLQTLSVQVERAFYAPEPTSDTSAMSTIERFGARGEGQP